MISTVSYTDPPVLTTDNQMIDSFKGQPSLISLFCGPGGLDEGFAQEGFQTGLAYDVEAHCITTLRHNHEETPAYQRDLSEINVREIVGHWRYHNKEAPVGLLGGPPCQSFSRGNVHKTENDPRDTLPHHYVRILRAITEELGLDFFIFENVPGLLDKNHIDLYRDFKERARESGFIVSEGILDAQYFGVPQVRKRVFVIGVNEARYQDKFHFPHQDKTQSPPTVRDAIGDLPAPLHFNRGLTPQEIEAKVGHPNHWCMRPMSKKFDPDNDFLQPGEIKGRSFRTLAWDQPSYTVAYGHREVHVHPSCRRRLSMFEALRLQGFPDSYELRGNMSQQIDMISDAVAPPVASSLARAIKMQLYGESQKVVELANAELPDVEGSGQLSFSGVL